MEGQKRKTILTVLAAAILLLSVIGVTYAYFASGVNNDNNQEVSITAGTMRLTFADNDTGISGSLNFGDSITKKFTIQNTGSLPVLAKISWKDLVNTYLLGSLTYTFEYSTSSTGTYTKYVTDKNVPRSTTATTAELMNGLEIPVGTTYYCNLIITLVNSPTVDQTADLSASFATGFTLEEGKTKSDITLAVLNQTPNTTTPNFANTATTAEGIFSAPDDYGTSYYYRGAVTNNYVQFAGFYWRIIRINGDGSLRLIYDGTSAHANGESSTDRQIGTSAFNTNYNDNAYVGYMYGTPGSTDYSSTHSNTNSSTIKTYIDNWYKTNIVDTGNSSAVADVIYCNDRELDSGTGAGTTETYYKANNRLVTNKTPKLSCTQKNDAFTVNDEEKGNGALTYPVGLITADEASYAGKTWTASNTSDYLYTGNYYWSAAPSYFYGDGAYEFGVDADLSGDNVRPDGARPVISLSAEYCENLQGDGLMTNPYKAP